MKRLTFITCLCLLCLNVTARTEKTITVDGNERSYVFYYPTGRATSELTQLVVALHGLGQTPDAFITPEAAQSLCDNYGMALLLPVAMPEQDNEIINAVNFFGADYPALKNGLNAVWGAGVSVSVNDLNLGGYASLLPLILPNISAAGKLVLNKDIDDISFINAAISDCAVGYNLKDEIYLAGGSLGGAMTYKYAFSNESKASKIAVISGFIGHEVDYPTSINYPIMVINSQTDELISYNGSVFNDPIEDIVDELVAKNPHGAPTTSTIGSGEGQINVYDYTEEPEVLFYSVTKAQHNMSDVQNINIYEEVWDFFNDATSAIGEFTAQTTGLKIWPNPARDFISTNICGHYTIYDMAGRPVMKGTTDRQPVNVANLAKGQYIVKMTAGQNLYRATLIKQ